MKDQAARVFHAASNAGVVSSAKIPGPVHSAVVSALIFWGVTLALFIAARVILALLGIPPMEFIWALL